jgi:uncharacterized membrane protein
MRTGSSLSLSLGRSLLGMKILRRAGRIVQLGLYVLLWTVVWLASQAFLYTFVYRVRPHMHTHTRTRTRTRTDTRRWTCVD